MSPMNEKAKERARGRTSIHISAQEYAKLTTTEKEEIREMLVEDGKDPDEWERNEKKLWPRKFAPKPLQFRER